MIARVATLKVRTDRIDEIVKYYNDSIFPVVSQKQGFRGGYLLTDRKTGDCLAVGYWDYEDQALADERDSQFKERISTIQEYVVSPPVWRIYEVSLKY